VRVKRNFGSLSDVGRHDLDTMPFQGIEIIESIGGSNPSLSANKAKGPLWGLLLYQGYGGFDENPSVRQGAAKPRRRTSSRSDGGPKGEGAAGVIPPSPPNFSQISFCAKGLW